MDMCEEKNPNGQNNMFIGSLRKRKKANDEKPIKVENEVEGEEEEEEEEEGKPIFVTLGLSLQKNHYQKCMKTRC
jgi:hypothetical protein